MTEKVVILARGRGTRMQQTVHEVKLDAATQAIAEKGAKTMIPIHGTPFLDYSLHNVIRAGFTKICLVVGPHSTRLHHYYTQIVQRHPHIEISFAIQQRPLGTADAVLAAQDFTDNDTFVLMNGDNLYSAPTLTLLRSQQARICYSAGFDKEGLLRDGVLNEQRLKQFALLQVDDEGNLVTIQEKPVTTKPPQSPHQELISMNLFRLTPHIYTACERIAPHPLRKEYEITSAIQYLIDNHIVPVKVLPVWDTVIDLTYSHDIPLIRAVLRGMELDV